MKITIVTPAPAGSRKGNRITALRWARLLRSLGHGVTIAEQYDGRACDVMVALHARRSFTAIEGFRREHPDLPLVVALTGTDLYGDIHTSPDAQKSLELATRFIVLQPMGMLELPERLRGKVVV